jgi:SagB-type dehydrogenase family enzyme
MSSENGRAPGGDLANAAVYANSFKPVDPCIRSTGLRTRSLQYQNLSRSDQPRMAEDFLVNTRLRRNDRENEVSIQSYFYDPGVVMLSRLGREPHVGFREVRLPPGTRLRMEVGQAMARRRSSRSYTGDAIDLDYLAAMVRSAAGITSRTEVPLMGGGASRLAFRATPSGGGLYPIHLYVAALLVRGLDKGVYRYNPDRDVLSQTGDQADLDKLLESFCVPDEVISLTRASVLFFLVAQPWRAMRKYGNRGMRFVFIEAGSMAQNINLASVALGFGSVECASVYDDEAHEALHLDGVYQALVHTLVVGCIG